MSTYTPTDEQLEKAQKFLAATFADYGDADATRSQQASDARIATLAAVRRFLDEAADATTPDVAVRLVARARAQLLVLDEWLTAR